MNQLCPPGYTLWAQHAILGLIVALNGLITLLQHRQTRRVVRQRQR
jgi:hypothetical protein